MAAQDVRGLFQVYSVPQHNGSDDKIQAACSILLLFEAMVADFA